MTKEMTIEEMLLYLVEALWEIDKEGHLSSYDTQRLSSIHCQCREKIQKKE